MDLLYLAIGAIFVNNILLAQYLGNCPFCGVSKKLDTSIGMGVAVVFVATLASIFTWAVYHYILKPYNMEFIQTLAFILIIASLVQFVEIFLKKQSKALYNALGIYLPLITTNCAVLGVALLTIQKDLNFFQTLIFAFGGSIGFTLALVLMAGIRETEDMADVPKPFKGTALAFITAGLLSLAFMGFSGIVK